MLFNTQKFDYVSFSSSLSSVNTNVYFSPSLDIINPSKISLILVLICLETVPLIL